MGASTLDPAELLRVIAVLVRRLGGSVTLADAEAGIACDLRLQMHEGSLTLSVSNIDGEADISVPLKRGFHVQ